MSSLRPYWWTRESDPNEPSPPPAKRGFPWRGVVITANILFALWLLSVFTGGSDCTGPAGELLDACRSGETIGRMLAALLVLGVWALVDVIVGVTYLVLRDKR